MADDSDITSKGTNQGANQGDRLLAGFDNSSRQDIFTKHSPQAQDTSSGLSPEISEEIEQRSEELARIRAGLLEAGISESALDDPESVDISHLTPDEQEEYNDAIREQRTLLDEAERDLRELREDRAKTGLNYTSPATDKT